MRGMGLVAGGLLLLGAAKGGLSQTVSSSKLSAHLDFHYTDGARQIIAAGPQVLKILGVGGEMMSAVRDYKAAHPDGLTVLRIYTTVHYSLQNDPVAAALDFWNRVLGPPLAQLSDDDRALIDFVEGPNEAENCPTWGSVESATWFGQFWAALAPLIAENGFRPCVGSIPVGNPPGTVQQIEDQLEAFTPALYAALDLGGAWSYHAYSILYTADEAIESWYSLRYRRFYDFLGRQHPELTSLPMILTEGGVGENGWRSGGADMFEQWLAWFDSEIGQDDYVLGVTLFEIGDPQGWPTFDIEPVAAWMADYLWMH